MKNFLKGSFYAVLLGAPLVLAGCNSTDWGNTERNVPDYQYRGHQRGMHKADPSMSERNVAQTGTMKGKSASQKKRPAGTVDSPVMPSNTTISQ